MFKKGCKKTCSYETFLTYFPRRVSNDFLDTHINNKKIIWNITLHSLKWNSIIIFCPTIKISSTQNPTQQWTHLNLLKFNFNTAPLKVKL